jgi:hypothetical protein
MLASFPSRTQLKFQFGLALGVGLVLGGILLWIPGRQGLIS